MKSIRRFALPALIFYVTFLDGTALAEDHVYKVIGTPNNQFKVVNTYPEYWVDGKPFCEYAASFFYHRIPRDRWAEELLRLRKMGVNTIDLYPFWNWHEPEEGFLDFDGHTNPRRDLKFLIKLLDSIGFKITVRPGPYYTSEWRNGGYPDWLLRRSEYRMSEQAILEGRYPRWSALQYDKSEEAATEWLKNETHLKYTRKWYHDVLALVNPLLAEKGGPVINIQIDDDQAIGRENYNGPDFWKYMELLRKYAKEATHDSKIPYYLNGADMRVNAEANDATEEPFWNTGQDYQMSGVGGYSTVYEAAKNKFLAETLKTEPLFVPTHIEFQAGWFVDEKDTYARPTDPSNTLMATRVMFQNGLKALNYYPLNDTLYPAGYECQWANYFYGWETAVNYAGKETARAMAVRRNGRLLAGMGPLLASSHFLPDAALVYPMATFPQSQLTAAETDYVAMFAGRVMWSGVYDHYNFELVDSDHTPSENFERYKLLLLPNLVGSKEESKRFPHLERYSDKAQQMMSDYVAAGGTLLIFPSLPKGKIFDNLLAPLGEGRQLLGNAPVRFADGTSALALGSRTILTLRKKPRAEVKVFARDARGSIVGARFAHGKGQVLFFGADFSSWSVPAGTAFTFEGGGKAGARDYPEETQRAGRLALPALMKEAGVTRKVYTETESSKARDLGLYVTELIADQGSLPFEKRASDAPGFGFVGVTNFSVEEARVADLFLTDPHLSDLTSSAPDRYLHLPRFTLPPRQAVMLPVHIPLSTPFWEMAPGLEATDEVTYATAELSKVAYDGRALRLEFTAPADGEVALRLSRRPEGAGVDGQSASIQEDAERRLYIVKIPRGESPHFLRAVELAYPGAGLRVTITPREPWIAGETRAVRVRMENPRATPLEGGLDFVAGAIYRKENPALAVHIPPRSSREFSFPAEIPSYTPEDQPVELVVTFREKQSSLTWAWRSEVTVHRPFDSSVGPVLDFPLREDQRIPIVHPTLASINLPGEATFQVRVKNWLDHEQMVTLTAEGPDLRLTTSSSHLALPAHGETTAEVHAAPAKGSGAYRFEIGLRSGDYQVKEGVVLAAIQEGEAIAYTLDYDRDGFQDVILENQKLRMFVSPHAGGRSFAFTRKDSGSNAFDSVGGLRDNFATRFEPEDMKGLPDWTRVNWLGLYNRPYDFRILSASGAQAQVRLEYTAPDIYPKGMKLERTLTLAGDQNAVLADTEITPRGIEKPQAFVLETSVPFKSFKEPNYNQWFTRGRGAEEFVPLRKVELAASNGFVGTVNKLTGETFALMWLSPAVKSQMVADNHSALIRVTYPDFAEKNETYKYRAAYCFGKESPADIEKLFARLKAGK
jgi:hypothetical protein